MQIGRVKQFYALAMNRWFEELGQLWTSAASRRRARLEAPALEPPVAQELLELARVTAHTQERRFAPLACYTAGLAVERLQRLDPTLSPDGVATYIREVWQQLEREAGSSGTSHQGQSPAERT